MKCVINLRSGCCIVICSLALLVSCSKKGDAVANVPNFVPNGINDGNVTYNNYIHLVLKNNCSTCHGKEGSAPQYWFNNNTYANAAQYGTRIMETIVEGSMPPAPRKPFSDADKNLFKAWINRGSPQ
jgi:uncharacterized membrane protein